MPDSAAALRQLQEVGGHIAEVIDLRAKNADLHTKLKAAEGRIERAREALKQYRMDPDLGAAVANEDALGLLSEPANAEGIASEGGSASAANPHEKETADAPSAEAACDHAYYADPIDGGWEGYEGACHDCDWRSGNVTADKGKARDDARRYHESLVEPAQPGWQALAGELAEAMGRERLSDAGVEALARYHEAAQHSGEPHG
jgi:hypothetical protein